MRLETIYQNFRFTINDSVIAEILINEKHVYVHTNLRLLTDFVFIYKR
jgi:hypothetical protein